VGAGVRDADAGEGALAEGFGAVSEVAGLGDAGSGSESDFESLAARTAHVMESTRRTSVMAVNEERNSLFSIIR
jgi:hypothetical protein